MSNEKAVIKVMPKLAKKSRSHVPVAIDFSQLGWSFHLIKRAEEALVRSGMTELADEMLHETADQVLHMLPEIVSKYVRLIVENPESGINFGLGTTPNTMSGVNPGNTRFLNEYARIPSGWQFKKIKVSMGPGGESLLHKNVVYYYDMQSSLIAYDLYSNKELWRQQCNNRKNVTPCVCNDYVFCSTVNKDGFCEILGLHPESYNVMFRRVHATDIYTDIIPVGDRVLYATKHAVHCWDFQNDSYWSMEFTYEVCCKPVYIRTGSGLGSEKVFVSTKNNTYVLDGATGVEIKRFQEVGTDNIYVNENIFVSTSGGALKVRLLNDLDRIAWSLITEPNCLLGLSMSSDFISLPVLSGGVVLLEQETGKRIGANHISISNLNTATPSLIVGDKLLFHKNDGALAVVDSTSREVSNLLRLTTDAYQEPLYENGNVVLIDTTGDILHLF